MTKECGFCKKAFETTRGFQKFCCAKCREKWYSENYWIDYNKKNKKRIGAARKEHYAKNKKGIIDNVKTYYAKNRRRIIKQKSEYKKANRPLYNEAARRRYEEPKERLNKTMSVLIRRSLKGNKNGRPWEGLVEYTQEQLRRHLEKQFRRGMTWENYGKAWHVDHKKPVAWFCFSAPEDAAFKECWKLTNLQPLWASENIRKGARWESQ